MNNNDAPTATLQLTAIRQPDGVAHPGITAYRDADGQLVLRITADAADALQYLIDDIGPGYDLSVNPGAYGVSDAEAQRVAAVRSAISNAIG